MLQLPQASPTHKQASRLMRETLSLVRSSRMYAQRGAGARMQKSEASAVSLTSKRPATRIHYSSVEQTGSAQNSASRSTRVCTILSVRTSTDSPSRITQEMLYLCCVL